MSLSDKAQKSNQQESPFTSTARLIVIVLVLPAVIVAGLRGPDADIDEGHITGTASVHLQIASLKGGSQASAELTAGIAAAALDRPAITLQC